MSKGGWHAYVTMLDDGFMVTAIDEAPEDGVYNFFSTVLDSMEEEDIDSVEEPGDNSQMEFVMQAEALMDLKRKRND